MEKRDLKETTGIWILGGLPPEERANPEDMIDHQWFSSWFSSWIILFSKVLVSELMRENIYIHAVGNSFSWKFCYREILLHVLPLCTLTLKVVVELRALQHSSYQTLEFWNWKVRVWGSIIKQLSIRVSSWSWARVFSATCVIPNVIAVTIIRRQLSELPAWVFSSCHSPSLNEHKAEFAASTHLGESILRPSPPCQSWRLQCSGFSPQHSRLSEHFGNFPLARYRRLFQTNAGCWVHHGWGVLEWHISIRYVSIVVQLQLLCSDASLFEEEGLPEAFFSNHLYYPRPRPEHPSIRSSVLATWKHLQDHDVADLLRSSFAQSKRNRQNMTPLYDFGKYVRLTFCCRYN